MSFFHRDPKESATQEKVAKKPKVLSGDSTVAEWLDHPVGGVIFRDMLHKAGQNENVLRIVRRLSLSRLIDMSKGQFTKEMLDDMVQKANAGEVPEGIEAAPATTSSSEHVTEPLPEWHETITPERFAGKTIIVTGAGSGIGRATASRVAREGKELGEADDIVFKETNSKQAGGAVGLLTGGLIGRADYYEQAMIFALIPHKNTDLYPVEK